MSKNVKKSTTPVGRPRRVATAPAISEPVVAPLSTPSSSNAVVKRNFVDDSKKPKIYTIQKGGGNWYKIKQKNITVFDEETGQVRQLRYSPNEMSVWADEQSENTIREQIVFIKGNLSVPYTKPNLIEYLNRHPDNKANGGNVFNLVDDTKKADMELDTEFEILDAVSMIRDKSIEELLPAAMYLGISTGQSNMEIKRELLLKAKVNPKGFIQLFDNPVVKVRSTVMSAVDFQILKSAPDGMKWYDTNKLIVSTPAGQSTIDIMTRFCLSEKGALVLEEIENQLNKI
jgi:hypothetical protein